MRMDWQPQGKEDDDEILTGLEAGLFLKHCHTVRVNTD